ncbi:MAG TPA: hypothetical protein DEP72_08020 [Clostridiales bacterium]|nr:MAG: hypothetical protein A2Y18_01145 [Clostridiales bacterium GWD2_32_19]HCC08082.1 hypothetical protein [Clostridiales bacterium]
MSDIEKIFNNSVVEEVGASNIMEGSGTMTPLDNTKPTQKNEIRKLVKGEYYPVGYEHFNCIE